jgi:hypothetical protein
MKLLVLLFLLFLNNYVALAIPQLVTINNTAPRLDNTGIILDGHDLSIRRVPKGDYVMYTNSYGLCTAALPLGCDQTPDKCGFRDDHNVSIYTSPDLTSGSWNFKGFAYLWTDRPAGVLYRPDAIYNAATGLWVLWINLNYVYYTSTSISPFGPFIDHRKSNLTLSCGGSGGDFHIFEVNNTEAYIIFSASVNHIAKLTSDYRDWMPNTNLYDFDEPFSEAPAVLYRKGLYYALFGHCCCFCLQGSGLFVYTASLPLGPWTRQSSPTNFDVACQAPVPPEPVNPFCAYQSQEGDFNVTLICTEGIIDSLSIALYGLQSGSCPRYNSSSTCNDTGFSTYAQDTCVGKQSCVLSTSTRPDPCLGIVKSISIVAHCSHSPGGYSPDAPVIPPLPPSNPFCATKSVEGDFNLTLQCINGMIDSIPIAFYGLQTGKCPIFNSSSTCNDVGFADYVQEACVGKQNCTISTSTRSDPCLGTVKSISIVAHCSLSPGGFSPDGNGGGNNGGAMPTPGQGCLYDTINDQSVSVTQSQQSAIVTVEDGNGDQTYLYFGDRWGQSPDGIKGHEPQFVYPITFNADGSIPHFLWKDQVSFMIDVGAISISN